MVATNQSTPQTTAYRLQFYIMNQERHILTSDELKEAFEKYYRRLIYYVRSRFRLEIDACEDIVATAFVKVSSALVDTSRISQYLYITTRNQALEFIRLGKFWQKVDKNYQLHPDRIDDNIEAWEIEGELLFRIHQAAELLPSECRKVFKAYFLEDKPTAQIAAEMGLNVQTVRNQKTRAITFLKQQLCKTTTFASLK